MKKQKTNNEDLITNKSNKKIKSKLGILFKITFLFLMVFLVPTGFMLYLANLTQQGLFQIQNQTSDTADKSKSSYEKTVASTFGITKLQAVDKVIALSNHISHIIRNDETLLENSDEIEFDKDLKKIINKQKIGKAGYVSIIDPFNDTILLHRIIDSDEAISADACFFLLMNDRQIYHNFT